MSSIRRQSLRGAVQFCHFFLRQRVRPGDRVVDATCGNGYDTLLLAQLVGPTGRVWAFDVQAKALDATRTLLAEHNCLAQVQLVATGHERLAEVIGEHLRAAVFNLGYLPGGDKGVITSCDSTLAGLMQAAKLLAPGGIISVCIYTGHAGGVEEERTIVEWAACFDPACFNVWVSRQLNRPAIAPYLLLVERSLP